MLKKDFSPKIYQIQNKVFHMLKSKIQLDLEEHRESFICWLRACAHATRLYLNSNELIL